MPDDAAFEVVPREPTTTRSAMEPVVLDRPLQAPSAEAAARPSLPARPLVRTPDAVIRQGDVAVLRLVLVIGSVVVAASVIGAFAPGAPSTTDPSLARLLRGMAAIKGLLAVAAAALVAWRLGHPIAGRVAAVYIACAWALVAASALIWQLAFIPAAAVLFHAAGLGLLVLALRDGRALPRLPRRA